MWASWEEASAFLPALSLLSLRASCVALRELTGNVFASAEVVICRRVDTVWSEEDEDENENERETEEDRHGIECNKGHFFAFFFSTVPDERMPEALHAIIGRSHMRLQFDLSGLEPSELTKWLQRFAMLNASKLRLRDLHVQDEAELVLVVAALRQASPKELSWHRSRSRDLRRKLLLPPRTLLEMSVSIEGLTSLGIDFGATPLNVNPHRPEWGQEYRVACHELSILKVAPNLKRLVVEDHATFFSFDDDLECPPPFYMCHLAFALSQVTQLQRLFLGFGITPSEYKQDNLLVLADLLSNLPNLVEFGDLEGPSEAFWKALSRRLPKKLQTLWFCPLLKIDDSGTMRLTVEAGSLGITVRGASVINVKEGGRGNQAGIKRGMRFSCSSTNDDHDGVVRRAEDLTQRVNGCTPYVCEFETSLCSNINALHAMVDAILKLPAIKVLHTQPVGSCDLGGNLIVAPANWNEALQALARLQLSPVSSVHLDCWVSGIDGPRPHIDRITDITSALGSINVQHSFQSWYDVH